MMEYGIGAGLIRMCSDDTELGERHISRRLPLVGVGERFQWSNKEKIMIFELVEVIEKNGTARNS